MLNRSKFPPTANSNSLKSARLWSLMLMLLAVLLTVGGRAQAQTASILEWTFGSTTYSAVATTKHAMVTDASVTATASGATAVSAGTSGAWLMATSQWSTTGATVAGGTSYWTSVAPVSGDKVIYFNFTPSAAASIDFSALRLQFAATRMATSAPVTARAFLVWNDGTGVKNRSSATATMSGTTAVTYNLDVVGGSSTGDALPVNPGGIQFHVELELYGATSATSIVRLDNMKLLANTFATGGCAVGNVVYNDANNNGFFNTGEGVSGVTVQLLNSGGTVIKTTTTSSVGMYYFANLAAGTYTVKIPSTNFASGQPLFGKISILPANPTDTTGDDNVTGNDAGIDNAAPATNGISSHTVTLAVGGEPTAEAGSSNTLDDAYDSNGDLTVDFGFKSAVNIVISPGTVPATTSVTGPYNPPAFSATGGTGAHTLTAPTKPAWMSFDPATGRVSGTPGTAGAFSYTITATDSLGATNSVTYNVTATASIVTGFVWNDANYDGFFSAGETPLSGITVEMKNIGADFVFGSADDTTTSTTTTSAAGFYSLALPGTFSQHFLKLPTLPPATPYATNVSFRQSNLLGQLRAAGAGGSSFFVHTQRLTSTAMYSFNFGLAANGSASPAGNLLNNPGFETGTFTSTETVAGSNAVVPSQYQAYPATAPTSWSPNWWLDGGPLSGATPYQRSRWIDASAAGGAVEGSKLMFSRSLADAINYCIIYDDIRPLNVGTSYQISAWVAAFNEATPASSSAAVRFEIQHPNIGANPNAPITINSISSGGTNISSGTGTTIVKWDITSPNPRTTTGVPYTGAVGQVLDWKSLGWQKISLQFTPNFPILQLLLSQTPNGGAGTAKGAAWDSVELATTASARRCDFGDSSLFPVAANGISTALKIGTNATDAENSSPTSGAADADDTTGSTPDDEDLDITTKTFTPGSTTNYVFPVTLNTATIPNARLMVWADWNGDGLFTGTNEVVTATPLTIANGTNNYTASFSPPAGTSGAKHVRFRVVEGTTTPLSMAFQP